MPSKDGSQREMYLGNGVTHVNDICISFLAPNCKLYSEINK